MKKTFLKTTTGMLALSLTFMVLALLASCGNSEPKLEVISDNVPNWVSATPPENMYWGIGTGKLSTVKASSELAKFIAQADITRQIATVVRSSFRSIDDPSLVELYDELNVYQNEFYTLLAISASERASFELSEFVKVEKRAKTPDGTIWYLLSLKKDAKFASSVLSDFSEEYINDYIEYVEGVLQ